MKHLLHRTLVAFALVAASCGSDAGPAATTEGAASVETEAPAAAVIPIAVCEGHLLRLYFGYENQGAVPIHIPTGAANELTGGHPGDNPLATTLFAPGRVEVAFWAFAPDGGGTLEWTITGSDGVARTARADASLPPCPDGFPADGTGDDGAPTLITTGVLSAAGDAVEFQIELTGLDETSVCPAGLTPGPVLASVGDGSSFPDGIETSASVVARLLPDTSGLGGQLASTLVVPIVVDQCTAAGVTARSWRTAGRDALNVDVQVCGRVDATGTLTVDQTLGSCGLPGTGGSSIRPT